jgi:hypothetical protein
MENKPRGNEPSFNWRGVVLIAIAFALIGLAVLFRGGAYANIEDVPYYRFLELLENKQIVVDRNSPLQLVVEEGWPTQTSAAIICKDTILCRAAGGFRTTAFLNYNTTSRNSAKANIQPAIKWVRLWRKRSWVPPHALLPSCFIFSSSRSAWRARAS